MVGPHVPDAGEATNLLACAIECAGDRVLDRFDESGDRPGKTTQDVGVGGAQQMVALAHQDVERVDDTVRLEQSNGPPDLSAAALRGGRQTIVRDLGNATYRIVRRRGLPDRPDKCTGDRHPGFGTEQSLDGHVSDPSQKALRIDLPGDRFDLRWMDR